MSQARQTGEPSSAASASPGDRLRDLMLACDSGRCMVCGCPFGDRDSQVMQMAEKVYPVSADTRRVVSFFSHVDCMVTIGVH